MFAQNIDCGFSLEPPHLLKHGLCVRVQTTTFAQNKECGYSLECGYMYSFELP